MSLLINLRHLEKAELPLKGKLPAAELDLDDVDELIRVEGPLKYDLEAQKLEKSILVQGSVELDLKCECARCLKPFTHRLEFADWACHLPLEGEEKAVVAGDCVDLTPFLREDILLELPQHPLCQPDCRGLVKKPAVRKKSDAGRTKEGSSAWTELNKLKFK
jgi:uncharacterized protein